MNCLSESTVIWPISAIFPFGDVITIVSWFPKARYFISPDIEIVSSSAYADLSVVTIIESFSPNAGVTPRLVIKIPNSAKIINWDFTKRSKSIYDI